LKKKGKKRKLEDTPQNVSQGEENANVTTDGGACEEEKKQEHRDISFQIDEQEDCVVLDADAEKVKEEDADDKAEKRVRMVRLDRSRTAGGVFCGCGFGCPV